MKLLIGGKSRNIYMRKDGSAYYKSGGQQVDITHMFKKNGGGLKKQYIGGVEGNLAKVERKKRSNKCVKQILGGVGDSGISFDPIAVNSENLVTKHDVINDKDDVVKKELAKLCYIALNGLSIKLTGLAPNEDKDKIKISILDEYRFKEYVDKNIAKTIRDTIYAEADDAGGKIAKIKADLAAEDKSKLKKLGFPGITFPNDGITVTRAYILNKILQCFDTADPLALKADNESHPDGVLQNRKNIIDPEKGVFCPLVDTNLIFTNIVDVLKICIAPKHDPAKLHLIVRNLHTILFKHEKIGAPAPPTGE